VLIKNMFFLSFIFVLVNCNRPIIDKCEVGTVVSHDLLFNHHSSVKNAANSTDTDQSNDLKDLDEDLHQVAGEYVLSIKLGIGDIQTADVVADTGSSDLVLSSKAYRPSASATNQNKPISLAYGSCSGEATLYSDTVRLECGDSIQQPFAYLSSSKSTCPSIMGLGYTSIARTGSSFFDNLRSKNGMQNLFSMLLCGQASGSQIILGGHIKNAPISALQYTPIIRENYYVMDAKNIAIKGGDIIGSLAGQTVILDSGTTISNVPASIHDAIVAAILQANPTIPEKFFTSTKPSDEDYTLQSSTIGDVSKLPTITITLA
jgi:Eukaryotic aspartyl protease